MTLLIRPETPRDYTQIAGVVAAAFGQEDEARLVERLRASEYYVPEWALVAEEGGEIVGHVMVSYATLAGRRVPSLAPVSVRPDRQNDGIGSALCRAVLARVEADDGPMVVVLGHPAYYPRFGFEQADRYGVVSPFSHTPGAYMVKPLASYDPSLRGMVDYPPPFSP